MFALPDGFPSGRGGLSRVRLASHANGGTIASMLFAFKALTIQIVAPEEMG
jgi:hypothetical protein